MDLNRPYEPDKIIVPRWLYDLLIKENYFGSKANTDDRVIPAWPIGGVIGLPEDKNNVSPEAMTRRLRDRWSRTD